MKKIGILLSALIGSVLLVAGSSFFLAYESQVNYKEGSENIMINLTEESSSAPEPFDILRTKPGEIVSSNRYNDFSLDWTSNQSREILKAVSKPSLEITYEYNENGYRTSKTVNDVVTTFTYGTVRGIPNTLVSENRNGLVINYTFDIDPVGSTARCIPSGFEINGAEYQLVFDSSSLVSGISDVNGNQIIEYEYSNGVVSSIYELNEDRNWQDVSNDPQSIGTINRIRYLGDYFDEETGWYYSDSYYDTVGGRFIDGGQT